MSPAKLTTSRLSALICFSLAAVTLALYWPITRHDFISLDDQQYITKNVHVQAGLTWPGIVWAFQSTDAANWHPLTWISHMADCQLYGLNPAGHHLTNILFHVANTLLLFLLLKNLTGALWRSAFVAALFAWHPLHVESVAWASERKDVLSTFFWMLTLIAYTRFVEESKVQNLKSKVFYVLALLAFVCGLMSKPMVVTLPFILLLIDFWPLGRISIQNSKFKIQNLSKLLSEKIPFFALATAASIVTYLAQGANGATWSLSALSIHVRISNALLSYLRYISKTFWPSNLAVIYPYQEHLPIVAMIGAALLLPVWTGLIFARARQNPYLLTGWLWFLGTLVPVIGLVQVGAQSMADRYMYIPSIGLFILVVWGLDEFFAAWPQKQKFAAFIGTAALGGCLICTSLQLKYWQNSVTLLTHTVEVTTDNYTACNFLGAAFEEAGFKEEAFALYTESVRIESHFPHSQFNLGVALLNKNHPDEAAQHLAIAAKLVPNDAVIRYRYGEALIESGKLNDAAIEFSEALRLNPAFPEAHLDLGVILAGQNQTTQAIFHFAEAVRLQPNNPDARFNFGLALLNNHQPAEAEIQFSEELKLTPDETKAHFRLAQALQQQNKLPGAVVHYREALRLTPDFPEAKTALDHILSANPGLKSANDSTPPADSGKLLP
jgi:tetratricopeptide (TPR) repeat protein